MATVHGHIRTIMSFFSKNGVKLLFSRGELKINPSEKDKVDSEWIPSNEEIRLLYRLAESARDRAVLLTLYQSGFSEIDVANMKIETFPFYNEKGDWAIGTTEDLYRKQRREKTNQWQQTCISREALEEIRIMLQSRGFPKEGWLFVSFRGEQLGVRGINDALTKLAEKGFNGKSKLWKTKHLRDAFMNGLHQGKVTQEIKDAMVGHKREGARNEYAITELTTKTAYSEAFKYLTINGYGSQSRKLEELQKQMKEDRQKLESEMSEDRTAIMKVLKEQQKQIEEMRIEYKQLYAKKLSEIEEFYPMHVYRKLTHSKTGETLEWYEIWNSPEESLKATELYMERWRKYDPEGFEEHRKQWQKEREAEHHRTYEEAEKLIEERKKFEQ